jgi:aromatic-L-amino-acid decarboxylase
MIAELYSSSVANPGFNWVCSPACTELEQVMMDWMAEMLGLADHFKISSKIGGGVIHNSASEAALTAAIAARGEREGKLVMYGSTQTHSLGAKVSLCWTS